MVFPVRRAAVRRRDVVRFRDVLVRRRAVVRFRPRFAIVALTFRLRRVVVFGAVRRRDFARFRLDAFAPRLFALLAAIIFFVARFCAAVRRRLGGFTMNSCPAIVVSCSEFVPQRDTFGGSEN
jgi:hypothetical protein